MSEVAKHILEVADEELVLDCGDHGREARQNTWSIGLAPGERAKIADALFECARRVGQRFPGVAGVFYAWYDHQNGHLYVSVTSRQRDDLPFGSRVELVGVEDVVATFCEQRDSSAWPGFTAVWATELRSR